MSSTITALTSGGGLAMAGDTSGQLELKTNNGTTAVTIDAGQNVGVGVTPSAWASGSTAIQNAGKGVIWQFGGTNMYVGQNYYYNGSNRIYISTAEATEYQQGAGIHRWYVMPSGTAGTAVTTFTQAMTLDNSGSLMVGTTTPVGRLNVTGTNAVATFNQTSSGNYCITSNPANNAGTYYHCAFNIGGTGAGQITSSGSSTTYSTSSDYRLKEDIAPMTGALDTVQKLKPVTYKWKIDGSNGEGFIAHELAEVCPQAVFGKKDAVELVDLKDEEGKIIGQEEKPVYQGIDTSFLVATLTAAIQELNAKVDAQALEIQALKGVA
jgi:hypothetical protein